VRRSEFEWWEGAIIVLQIWLAALLAVLPRARRRRTGI
jgi:hypothetical protein